MCAIVLTVKTGKRTTGIGADTKISIGRYRYPPILAGSGRYPIPDTGIGLTLVVSLYMYIVYIASLFLSQYELKHAI